MWSEAEVVRRRTGSVLAKVQGPGRADAVSAQVPGPGHADPVSAKVQGCADAVSAAALSAQVPGQGFHADAVSALSAQARSSSRRQPRCQVRVSQTQHAVSVQVSSSGLHLVSPVTKSRSARYQ